MHAHAISLVAHCQLVCHHLVIILRSVGRVVVSHGNYLVDLKVQVGINQRLIVGGVAMTHIHLHTYIHTSGAEGGYIHCHTHTHTHSLTSFKAFILPLKDAICSNLQE